MRERIGMLVFVTLIAGTIWLFAEAESLGEEREPARILFRQRITDNTYLRIETPGFDGRITLTLKGSRGSLDSARALLDNPIELEPGVGLVPESDGVHTLELLSVLRTVEALRKTGVRVEAVSPPQVVMHVSSLEDVEFEVSAKIPASVRIARNEVLVNPLRVTARLPRALAARARAEGWTATAMVDEDQVAGLPKDRRVTLDAQVTLPEAVRELPDMVKPTPAHVQVTFLLEVPFETTSINVPVQVLSASVEWPRWEVTINPADELLHVTVSGPAENVARITAGDDRLIAALSLTDNELANGIESKAVGIMMLRSGVPVPVPSGLTVEVERSSVRFTISKKEES